MDQVNITPEQKQEDPEYIQQMVNKAEGADGSGGTQDPAQNQQEPEQLLAGKYKNEDELAKGVLELLKRQNEGKDLEAIYKELESGLGKQQEPEPTKDEPAEEPPKEEPKAEGGQLDLEAMTKEFEETGQLSEDSYEKLQAAGIPKEMVDAYLQGLQAIAQQQINEVYGLVGGEDNYNAMIDWAANNLTDDEKGAFNQAINAGSAQAKFAVEALYTRFTKATGNPPKTLLQGTAPAAGGEEVYESRAQLVADMNDPRYKTDPAFRRRVQEKLQRSNIL